MNDHQEFADAVAMVAGGAVDIPVDTVFAFEDFPAAIARLEVGAQLGKLVLGRDVGGLSRAAPLAAW